MDIFCGNARTWTILFALAGLYGLWRLFVSQAVYPVPRGVILLICVASLVLSAHFFWRIRWAAEAFVGLWLAISGVGAYKLIEQGQMTPRGLGFAVAPLLIIALFYRSLRAELHCNCDA